MGRFMQEVERTLGSDANSLVRDSLGQLPALFERGPSFSEPSPFEKLAVSGDLESISKILNSVTVQRYSIDPIILRNSAITAAIHHHPEVSLRLLAELRTPSTKLLFAETLVAVVKAALASNSEAAVSCILAETKVWFLTLHRPVGCLLESANDRDN